MGGQGSASRTGDMAQRRTERATTLARGQQTRRGGQRAQRG